MAGHRVDLWNRGQRPGGAHPVDDQQAGSAALGKLTRSEAGEATRAALSKFDPMKFSELVRLLEQNGFRLLKEKGSVRYYLKRGHPRLIRVDFHGAKEVPTGTCQAILKAAGLKRN